MSDVPIAKHALLSDCHCAALVTRAGSVDRLCCPRFDSPSVVARMLEDEAGHWSIRPVAEVAATRRYLDRSMVLETSYRYSRVRDASFTMEALWVAACPDEADDFFASRTTAAAASVGPAAYAISEVDRKAAAR